MFHRLVRGAAPLLLVLASSVLAQSGAAITAQDLRRHIDVLAGDDFEGRAPGTPGETRTTEYIAEQLRARGVEPAGEGGTWLQPVGLVERQAGPHQVRWTAGNRELPFDQSDIVLVGREASQRVADAPVVFVGHGARLPERGIDQLAGADLRGAVAMLLLEGPDVAGFPSLAERVRAVDEAGAAAIVTIVAAEIPWSSIRRLLDAPITRRDGEGHAPILGTMSLRVAGNLIGAERLRQLLDSQPGSSFRAVTLPLRVSMDVQTDVRRFTSNNVVGRLRGTGATGESVLFLAHWDHLGLCRPEGEADRICNGAVDNASGIATMIEVAGRLAQGPRPVRDILFLATTAEELGLIGAEEFAARPVVPLSSIVAALNS
ncbi:MAG TPA: M28 family peptidase, partial [Allosphingosinicella sp.]|nr:M28 family peptidase [Allosphingosinicella sp.]